jgi:hypothetical protein
MDEINTVLVTDRKTNATFSDIKLDYKVRITGDNKHATIDYGMILIPTLNNYVLYKGSGSYPTTFDLSWR